MGGPIHTDIYGQSKQVLSSSVAAIAVLVGAHTSATADDLANAKAAKERGRYSQALQMLKPLADQGNCEAQIQIGLLREFGDGVRKDHAKALNSYRKCANLGNAHAEYLLGVEFVGSDTGQAISWLTKAAEQGLPIAEGTLAAEYELGGDVPQDYVAAARWYEKAARHRIPFAAEALGRMYQDGRGVKRDPATAYLWFNVAHRLDPSDRWIVVQRRKAGRQLKPAQAAAVQSDARRLTAALPLVSADEVPQPSSRR